jgi:hypothetical protein
MINVKELRIGNLIECHVIDNVDGTDEWVDNYVNYDDIGWLSLQKNDERYRPKVLTEEMLVKFGCIEHENRYWDFLHDSSIYGNVFETLVYNLDDQSFIVSSCDQCGYVVPCKYVHQLQNLYFALTGEELEIKEVSK